MAGSDVVYILLGYLCGSILFAKVAGRLLNKKDITDLSADGNPGTANAFTYGGFWCGVLTLCGDLLKGMLPVHLYLERQSPGADGIGLIFVLAAPVAGHIFPVFYGFRGGKGIAVTFGVLLGLMPDMRPALILAAAFLIFSFIIQITPNYNRTLWSYWCAAVCMFLPGGDIKVAAAFLIITIMVTGRLHFSKEERESCKVKFL